MRPHPKNAATNASAPNAWAVCDRCGFVFNHVDLVWAHDWRGNQLANLQILVCRVTCLDKPFEHNRPIVLPPDPMPIDNPRVESYSIEEA